MKNILLDNMLRFGTKNLSEKTQRTIEKLAEQDTVLARNRATTIYGKPSLSQPQGFINTPVYFKFLNSPQAPLFLSMSTVFIKNVFGSKQTLLSIDLFDAKGTDDTNVVRGNNHYGLQFRRTADSQVVYAMDKPIDNNADINTGAVINKTLQNSYFPMWSLEPTIEGPMPSHVIAYLITKAFSEELKSDQSLYKKDLNKIMANIGFQPGLLKSAWNADAISRLKTAITNDPELKELSTSLIKMLNT